MLEYRDTFSRSKRERWRKSSISFFREGKRVLETTTYIHTMILCNDKTGCL
jgi:hypothetical protein